jgi:hypothetical protein
MAQTDCTWHLLFLRRDLNSYSALCWRYADSLWMWARCDDYGAHIEPCPEVPMAELFASTVIHQYKVPPAWRAMLRAKLDAMPCKECRCMSCTAYRSSLHMQRVADRCLGE